MKPAPTYTILERPLNTAQAAKFAGCSASTIRKAREAGGLESFIPCGLTTPRYTREAVVKWMRGE